MNTSKYVKELTQASKNCALKLSAFSAKDRREALILIANNILSQKDIILTANQKDLENAKKSQLSFALTDRLELNEKRIQSMVNGVKQIAEQDDPIGQISNLSVQKNGFKVGKMRTPIGVIGIIYESRPNVTVDAAAICIKSGNACILRGGSEAFYSNQALSNIIQSALSQSNLPQESVQFIETTSREAVSDLLQSKDNVDVIIPRGGKGLVKVISETAKVPVIKHLDGICHVYIDNFADNDIAKQVTINAKTYRYGICGAMETLLIHKDKVDELMPSLIDKFKQANVELVADESLAPKYSLSVAHNEDWETEYLCAKLSIKQVDSVSQAIEHINQYGSHHTDAIITNNSRHQNLFLAQVDSSSVMVNTPTCFADGFEYGLGAEIGISTDKLHVRGPVGVLGLTTEKYIVLGNGEIRT